MGAREVSVAVTPNGYVFWSAVHAGFDQRKDMQTPLLRAPMAAFTLQNLQQRKCPSDIYSSASSAAKAVRIVLCLAATTNAHSKKKSR
jgi:hypothetical protein